MIQIEYEITQESTPVFVLEGPSPWQLRLASTRPLVDVNIKLK